jgi:hypothetical protein
LPEPPPVEIPASRDKICGVKTCLSLRYEDSKYCAVHRHYQPT